MSAVRSSSVRAIRQLARKGGGACTINAARGLHMTGAAAQPRLPLERGRALPLRTVESKQQEYPEDKVGAGSSRTFNTSRALKAVNDSSTIDFAYLPTFPMPSQDYESETLIARVPVLPAYSPSFASKATLEASTPSQSQSALMPTISLVAAESTHIHAPSAMSDVHDGLQHETTDYHDVASTIASGAADAADSIRQAGRRMFVGTEGATEEVFKAKGLLKGAWTGLMHDVFGPPAGTAKA